MKTMGSSAKAESEDELVAESTKNGMIMKQKGVANIIIIYYDG